MRFVSIVLFALSLNAHAAKSQPARYYVNGRMVTAEEAVLAAVNGGEVLKCQPVEVKPTKTGLSLKTAKAK